ncbi:hypothetical protein B0H63DRAFT_395896 [Podospora didyma]|uniref:Lytic polysaccharide monooxygenase n=1 Tax=Podospora didyma TaxID=330526 RepID=A0AAE0NG26_9PEZI|nr:hypothetical protein B0H63DRAFT_395896 [Podospora didyma]
MIANTVLATGVAAVLLGAANGHMIMNTPTPYNYHKNPRLVQVDPLGAAHPFPCQGLSTPEFVTPITAGSTQLVNFTGGAQHGGGSCQFSLTYEYPPPKDKSKWKTIYTLIGGCPVSAAGNLPEGGLIDQDGRADAVHCGNDSGTECIRQFNVPIPKGLPSGNATFAWTWYNKIGNRELYMNCAPVSIQGGSTDANFFNSLPQMFVANVPGECTTGQGVLNIPNPGNFGKVLEQPAAGSEGSCPKANGIPTFDGVSNKVPAAAPAAATTSSLAGPSKSAGDMAVISLPPTVVTIVPTAPGSPMVIATAPNSPIATAIAEPGVGSTSTSSSAVPCSPDGVIVCMAPGFFGLCDHGKAVKQALAAGTTCSGGKIVRRIISSWSA